MSVSETLSSLYTVLESSPEEVVVRWGTIGEIRSSDFCVFFPGDDGFVLVDQAIASASGCERGDKVLVTRIDSGSWVLLGKLQRVATA